jgi:acetyl-CoA carboxylase carboxyltransferase component
MKILLGIGGIHSKFEVLIRKGFGQAKVLLKNKETDQEETITIPFLEIGVEEVGPKDCARDLLRKECHKMVDMLFEQALERQDME